ncbi:helix-turn-helix domain-containing protein [Nonlabens ponticola]|uniref:DNA-binding protein n=1 Tax=Nonlabens ponticola TaxID=2496866 RepID=A0A3S9MY38_9FLAO|nr:helix-turn-helix domain-containing protein [Nonlabens ponticola]AZQ44110.1 DNA-binding protein [Nonlabens ponticola]
MEQEIILQKLANIETMLQEQNLLKKDVLNLNEAAAYLDISASHLYKLTSQKQIPHFCPQGKKLYFNRTELDQWLQRNRQITKDEIDAQATEYLIRNS